MLKLHNSLTRNTEELSPIKKNRIGLYVCGPTVYNYLHIGNLRTMVFADLLRRALAYDGLTVTSVMNITDVGHLTSDADTGEDKMEKQAQTAQEVMAISDKYTNAFMDDLKLLNIEPFDKMPKASDHVPQQVAIIEQLIHQGFAYESDEAVYFDVEKFPNYNQLSGQKLEDMMLGARQEVVSDSKKKNPIDFVLWFKAIGRYANHILKWPSPWGEGFPGWHIECSAMSREYLGQPFDIHAGGIDLKFPHHTNEIAQSEAAFGEKLAQVWVHAEHLLVDKTKMSKSLNNFYTLKDLQEKDYSPLVYRYLVLTSHYRTRLNFTWDSLAAARNALNNLYSEISTFDPAQGSCPNFEQAFGESVDNDLDTPKALAVVWDMLKSENSSRAKLASLIKFDLILGLNIKEVWEAAKAVPDFVHDLINEREKARKEKDWSRSDELRKDIESNGYIVEDTVDGFRIRKKF